MTPWFKRKVTQRLIEAAPPDDFIYRHTFHMNAPVSCDRCKRYDGRDITFVLKRTGYLYEPYFFHTECVETGAVAPAFEVEFHTLTRHCPECAARYRRYKARVQSFWTA